ncbi:MAG: tetratricopeptide repeat protein [Pseudomonadota bacterium]
MRAVLLIALLAWPVAAPAQDADAQTLADIRQELSVVYVAVQRLKRELATTSAPNLPVEGLSFLQRLDAIEAALQRLTARSEELENRINRIVEDGTNRIADLEFRLIELEGGDFSQLSDGTTLGGEAAITQGTSAPAPAIEEPELAVGEQADFDRAVAAFEAEEFPDAIRRLEAFTIAYPQGPLSSQANLLRGDAHLALDEVTAAARAFLDAFSGAPEGPVAPEALYKLGVTLGDLGQVDQACVTLAEVSVRFPDAQAASNAEVSRRALACN